MENHWPCIRLYRYIYTLLVKIHLFINCLVQTVTKSEIRCRGAQTCFCSIEDQSCSIISPTLTCQGDDTLVCLKVICDWWVKGDIYIYISLLDETTNFIKHKCLPIAWPTRTGTIGSGWLLPRQLCLQDKQNPHTRDIINICHSWFLTNGWLLTLHSFKPILTHMVYIKIQFLNSTYMFQQPPTIIRQWHTQEFCSGGVQQIQLRTEDRENGDLGAVAP